MCWMITAGLMEQNWQAVFEDNVSEDDFEYCLHHNCINVYHARLILLVTWLNLNAMIIAYVIS